MDKVKSSVHTPGSADSDVVQFVFSFSHVRQTGVSVPKSTSLQWHQQSHYFDQTLQPHNDINSLITMTKLCSPAMTSTVSLLRPNSAALQWHQQSHYYDQTPQPHNDINSLITMTKLCSPAMTSTVSLLWPNSAALQWHQQSHYYDQTPQPHNDINSLTSTTKLRSPTMTSTVSLLWPNSAVPQWHQQSHYYDQIAMLLSSVLLSILTTAIQQPFNDHLYGTTLVSQHKNSETLTQYTIFSVLKFLISTPKLHSQASHPISSIQY